MKAFTYLLPALAAIASAGKIDECAGSCISKAIAATGCSSSDSLCICSANSFIESVESCGPCSSDGSNPAVALAQNYCESVSLSKRSYEWGGHSYGWWQKEWRKVRAGHHDSKGDGKGPSSHDPKPADPKPEAPQPYGPKPAEPVKSKQPVEDWFSAHPNYLINHPGWLNSHPSWATKHNDFLKGHLPTDSPYWGKPQDPPSPPSYPGKPDPPRGPHGYPQPPPQPHTTAPVTGKPTPTTTCTTNKPTHTVW
ncbi:hypothetical protein LTR09_001691 [Extremus antarcticus]|uniref:CFEM domain-containing protein n=1 Tax=Extremus antarcticus TaxID=702011 RepID=A0AAJ0GH79_9PEZI|nr:hypothetical protein LTR09_001691 [Extremus antarcticus]